MMMLLLALALAAQADPCFAANPSQTHRWLSDALNAAVVVTHEVPSSLQVGKNNLRRLTSSQAVSLVTDKLPASKYYYLTKARGELFESPHDLSLEVQIDSKRVAYIFTFVPRIPWPSPVPVVVATKVPLIAAVPVCRSIVE